MRFSPLLIIATLTACAPFTDCPREYVICDPETKRCICDRPTASLPAAMRGEGEPQRVTPEPEEPEEPGGGDGDGDGEHHDREPSRRDYDSEDDYRDAHDAWKERTGR